MTQCCMTMRHSALLGCNTALCEVLTQCCVRGSGSTASSLVSTDNGPTKNKYVPNKAIKET